MPSSSTPSNHADGTIIEELCIMCVSLNTVCCSLLDCEKALNAGAVNVFFPSRIIG